MVATPFIGLRCKRAACRLVKCGLRYMSGVMRSPCVGDGGDPVLSRKASSDVCVRPVPETDTGSQVENTKAVG